jgi:ABC-type nitrate/sulfonate/bicarbonate transport system substrate-binding protein
LELRAVTRTSAWNAALKDGRVQPEGFTLQFEEVEPVTRAFRRMVRELAYDMTEMAITTYLVAREHGKPITALPVFLTRGFHHRAVLAREPGDPRRLEGERVGVNRGYTVTTGVWARGILSSEHGVDLDNVTWVRSDEEHVAEYEPPPNVVSLEEGQDLAGAVLAGELAAVVGDVEHPELVPLLPDAEEAGFRYLRERGNWPVNHLVVVKDELLAAHPDLAPALVEAYERAKDLYVDGGELEPLHARVREITGGDPLPYGLGPNRAVIEELIEHAVAQRILRSRPDVDALFV